MDKSRYGDVALGCTYDEVSQTGICTNPRNWRGPPAIMKVQSQAEVEGKYDEW